MTIADDIEGLVKRKWPRLKLTEDDIAEMLFGQERSYQQRVNKACRQLVDEKKLEREGQGIPYYPYTYKPRILQIDRRI